MARSILRDVSQEPEQEVDFAWINVDDGTINPVETLSRIEFVLEYLAYADSSHGDLELEGKARNGRWLILQTLSRTVRNCGKAVGNRPLVGNRHD